MVPEARLRTPCATLRRVTAAPVPQSIAPEEREEDEVGTAWIHGPWATPETWDRDAPALVAAFADDLPGERVRLTCDSTQTAAVALHERLGFHRVGQTRAWDRRS